MALSVAEIRRIEAAEHEIHVLKSLVEHAYNKNDWERPPLPEFPGEYGLRGMTAPTIPPAALDAMMAALSEADKAQLLSMFARALQPAAAPAPAPVVVVTPTPTLAPVVTPSSSSSYSDPTAKG